MLTPNPLRPLPAELRSARETLFGRGAPASPPRPLFADRPQGPAR